METKDQVVSSHFTKFVYPVSLNIEYNNYSYDYFTKIFNTTIEKFDKDPLWERAKDSGSPYILEFINDFFRSGNGKDNELITFELNSKMFFPNGKVPYFFKTKNIINVMELHFNSIKLYLFCTGIGILTLDCSIGPIEILSDENLEKIPKDKREERISIEEEIKRIIEDTNRLVPPYSLMNPLNGITIDDIILFNNKTKRLSDSGGKNKAITFSQLCPFFILSKKISEQYEIPEYTHNISGIDEIRGNRESNSAAIKLNDLILKILTPLGEKEKDWKPFFQYDLLGFNFNLLKVEPHIKHNFYKNIARKFYSLRNFYSEEYLPSKSDIELEGNPYIQQTFENIYFGFSSDGGAGIAFETEAEFVKSSFTPRIKGEYFKVFLIALHQKLLNLKLGQLLSNILIPDIENHLDGQIIKPINSIRNLILKFTVKFWFPTVSNRIAYNTFYEKWLNVFQIEKMHEELRREINEVDDFLDRVVRNEEETARKQANEIRKYQERIMNAVAFIFLPLTLITGIWGMNFIEIAGTGIAINNPLAIVVSGIIIIITLLYYLIMRVLHNKKLKSSNKN